MVTNLMMSAKIAILDFLELKVFWSKGYDVIIFVYDVTNKILSRESSYMVDLMMWPKFDNSSISIREVIVTSILQGFNQKKTLFWRCGLGSSSIISDWH